MSWSSPRSRWGGSASPTRSFARRSTSSSRLPARRRSTAASPPRSSRRPRTVPTSAPARSPTTTVPPASCARRLTTIAAPPRRRERVHAQETALENLQGAILAGEMLGMTAATEETIRDLYRARAWTLDLLGEPERALADLEHALEGARAAGDRASEMHVRNALGTHWHVLRSAGLAPLSRRGAADRRGARRRIRARSARSTAFRWCSPTSWSSPRRSSWASGRYRSPAAPATSLPSAARWTASSSPRCSSATSSAWRSSAQSSSDPNAERGDLWYLQWTLCESCYVPLERCDWQEAERRVAEALAISDRVGGERTSGVLFREASSWIARCRGDYARSLGLRP